MEEITEEEKQRLYREYCMKNRAEGYKPFPMKIWWESLYEYYKQKESKND